MPGEFEWHPGKAESNAEKHGVTFDEAAKVFTDPRALTYVDPDHSQHEERQLTIGKAGPIMILIVSHTDRAGVIRIISARKASRKEILLYESA
jgi:uncharacterized DUF497 family protein